MTNIESAAGWRRSLGAPALGRGYLFGLVLAFSALSAKADMPLNLTIDDNVVTADLHVTGGFSAELEIRFEDVIGLGPETLDISAVAVNPLDPQLLARLPAGAGASIPAAFPLLLRIEPDPSKGLSFSGVVEVELYTHDLEFVIGSPLRLYSAPLGGTFRDITSFHGAGSYRSGGTKGNFSEFIIVAETRAPLGAAGDKLSALRTLLYSYANELDPTIYGELSDLLAGAETAFADGALVSSVKYVEAFADAVEGNGAAIPNVWAAAHNLENIAGQLRSGASTLRFSLTLAINGG